MTITPLPLYHLDAETLGYAIGRLLRHTSLRSNRSLANAAARLDTLLSHPAVVRFVSCEPLLGPLDLTPWLPALQWVIVGGESGVQARPMWPVWARSLREQCQAAGVPLFFKQWEDARTAQAGVCWTGAPGTRCRRRDQGSTTSLAERVP